MNVKARSGIAALMALAIAAIAATPAAADQPWGFEMVTPPVKGAGTVSYVDTYRASPDGEALLYSANSPFSSIPTESSPAYTRYIAHRGPDGWTNRALDPPYDAGEGSGAAFDINGVVGSSRNLDYVLVASTTALTPGATEGGGNLYMRNTRTGETKLVATSPQRILSWMYTGNMGPISVNYIAPDGRAAIFASIPALVPGAPENAEHPTSGGSAYSWTESGGLELLSRLPDGEAVLGAGGGYGTENGARESTAYEGGLDYAYFTHFNESGYQGVYVRHGGVTEPVSYSRISNDPADLMPAAVDAVASGGRYMLFHTVGVGHRLTTDTPELEAEFLYRYDAVSESLDFIGTYRGYGNPGVIRMTQDGQTIAFGSNDALTEGAVAERPNLYVWRNGDLKLAAVLDSTESSGASIAFSMRTLSDNGRYLAFTDDSASLAEAFGQATTSPNCPLPFVGGDGPCDQVYVYDADSEELQCASCLPDGAPPAGDAGDPLASNSGYVRMDSHQMQTVADDGTVFFTSKDGLLPSDKNELEDVYAYHDGELRLLSRATQGHFSRFIEATPDGKTVFFETDDPISPTDTDRAVDIYMTRAGAGFPYTPPPTIVPCEGAESCRDGVAPKPGSPSPGSASFSGRGNAKDSKARKARVSVAKARPAQGVTASLLVRAPGKGTLRVSGAGIKPAAKTVGKAATYKLKATLTAGAKRALQKSSRLRKKVKVTFRPREGTASSVTLTVTYKAAATRKGK